MTFGRQIPGKRKFNTMQRRKELARLLKDNPGLTQREASSLLGVTRETIQNDIKVMTEEMQLQSREHFMMHRDRILRELQGAKIECMDRLNRLSAAHQGSRWMQEWQMLLEKEIRMLGLNAPEKLLIGKGEEIIDKRSRDAAYKAAIAQVGINDDDIIDVEGEEIVEDVPALPGPDET